MNPAQDLEDAIKSILVTIADEISVEDTIKSSDNPSAPSERVLCAKIGDEIIGRIVVFGSAESYPIDVASKMPGFRISMTIRNTKDWGRNMAYLIDGYQKYRAKVRRDLKMQ